MRTKTIINSCIFKICHDKKFEKIFVYGSENLEIEKLLCKLTSSPIIGGDVNFYNSLIGNYYAGIGLNKDKNLLKTFNIETELEDIDYLALNLIYNQYKKLMSKGNLHFKRIANNLILNKNNLTQKILFKLKNQKINLKDFYNENLEDFTKRVDNNDLLIIDNRENALDFPKGYKRTKNLIVISNKKIKLNDKTVISSIIYKNLNIYSNLLDKTYLYSDKFAEERIEAIDIVKSINFDELIIKQLTFKTFNNLRKRYLSKKIHHLGMPKKCYGLFDTQNKLIGAFGLTNDFRNIISTKIEGPSIYLLCDFAVNSNTKHLSKLLLYCVLSKEVKLLAERLLNKETKTIVTNVFSSKMTSMKYRGLFSLIDRKQQQDGSYNLTYYSNMGQWTLKEGLELWKQKSLK